MHSNKLQYCLQKETKFTDGIGQYDSQEHAQAAAVIFCEKANGTADAYPTTEEVVVRLLCLVLSGGAAHIPIEDKLDRLDIMAKLDAGI
jgi:hypothetical protein